MRELKSIEERILDRALYLMGKNKTCDISIRAIAKEADVNVSAINYYFRTKEQMLRLVKEFYIENTLTVAAILRNNELEDEERLVLAANEIMEYSLRFPGNMVILRDSVKRAEEEKTSKRVVELSLEIENGLSHLLRQVIPGDDVNYTYKTMIFLSSVNYPTEYEGMANFGSSLLAERENRIAYLTLLLRTLKSA
jgi:AcrR family transcriptional regulator